MPTTEFSVVGFFLPIYKVNNMTFSSQPQRIVIIGNGMVGHHFVEQLVNSDQPFEITVLSGENRLAYDRVYLSSYFSGKTAQDLALTDEETYENWGVRAITNAWVSEINPSVKQVVTQSGDIYPYDKLVLATGSYPFVPPIPGNDNPHCLVYRTIDDLEAISSSAAQSHVGVVVGGGLLGTEVVVRARYPRSSADY